MKRIAFLVVLALALPLAAFANSQTDFVSWTTGSLSVSNSGVTMSAMLTGASGLNGSAAFSGDLGTMSFSTGALLSTSTFGSAIIQTFASGGSFMITGNGADGLPSGTIFKGTFSGDVTLLTINTHTDNGLLYLLTCVGDCSLKGSLYNGTRMTSATGSLIVTNIGGSLYAGTSFETSVTPEPSTLGLLGTGLLGLGALVRRKIKG